MYKELDDVISKDYMIYAHTSEDEDKPSEALREHTALCMKYFHRIMKEKRIEDGIDRFLKSYGEDELKDIFLKIIEYMIIFHDAGKINPAFQREAMGNLYKNINDFECVSGSDHALLSSYIYLDYCYSFIESNTNLKRSQKRKIKTLAFVNAYVISRHHSDLSSLDDFLLKFKPDGGIYNMAVYFTNNSQPLYKGPFFFREMKADTNNQETESENKRSIQLVVNTMDTWEKGCRKEHIERYFYIRLMYSLLVSCDYYATSEYRNGVETKYFGDLTQKDALCRTYNQSELISKIRKYERENYGKEDLSTCKDINFLRSEMFLDVERTWEEHKDNRIFFLEAPTGSGKSNTSMNISFKMLMNGADKIFYIYPFNTLVEQNIDILNKTFKNNEDVLSGITIVNSLTPIKTDAEKTNRDLSVKETERFYQKALLDRQFLNYPFILSTHVSLFNTMFGASREDVFGFLQLANSVIVLDEIQSYKNKIWTEIICFLKVLADFMDCRIIIMSATLPDLEYLTVEKEQVIRLMENRNKYFYNPLFKDRVKVSYELINGKTDNQKLFEHIKRHVDIKDKVLIEFIMKKSAYDFYGFMCDQEDFSMEVRLLTGDDNQVDRKKLLNEINELKDKGVILIATQVVEAGVDIDMDIGYKDISKLDSEEQFMGRINRSCRKSGKVYFFNRDSASDIYKHDYRISKELTLENPSMQEILKNKNFQDYYMEVLTLLKEYINEAANEDGLEEFFNNKVARGFFKDVEERMKLIEDDQWHMSVYLSRKIVVDGCEIDGDECWEHYRELLMDRKMPYAQKRILLSRVVSKMINFIYKIKKNNDLAYNDRIGEIYKIDNGEDFFTNGKLDPQKFERNKLMLIDM